MARYKIYDNKSDVITPAGEKLTAEQWLDRYQWGRYTKMRDYTPQKSSGNMSSSSSKSMVSSSDTSTHSMFSFPLIAHEYISAAAREENTSCIGSPFSNQ